MLLDEQQCLREKAVEITAYFLTQCAIEDEGLQDLVRAGAVKETVSQPHSEVDAGCGSGGDAKVIGGTTVVPEAENRFRRPSGQRRDDPAFDVGAGPHVVDDIPRSW